MIGDLLTLNVCSLLYNLIFDIVIRNYGQVQVYNYLGVWCWYIVHKN